MYIALSSLIDADFVEQRDEFAVGLSVYFLQLDRHQFHLAESVGIEEEKVGVVSAQNVAHIGSNYRFELKDVAHEEELLSPEWFAHILVVDAENAVHEVDHVGTYHRNLVDDNQVELLNDFHFLFWVTERLADLSGRIVGVVGDKRLERHLEERVHSHAPHIHGSDAGGGEDNEFLPGCLADIFQERTFSCSGFTG